MSAAVRETAESLAESTEAKVEARQKNVADARAWRELQLLTAKPVLYVCNVEEAAAATGNAQSRRVEDMAAAQGAGCVVISAAIEAEIALLEGAEREAFLAELGLAESGLERMIRTRHPELLPSR